MNLHSVLCDMTFISSLRSIFVEISNALVELGRGKGAFSLFHIYIYFDFFMEKLFFWMNNVLIELENGKGVVVGQSYNAYIHDS